MIRPESLPRPDFTFCPENGLFNVFSPFPNFPLRRNITDTIERVKKKTRDDNVKYIMYEQWKLFIVGSLGKHTPKKPFNIIKYLLLLYNMRYINLTRDLRLLIMCDYFINKIYNQSKY